MVGYTKLDYDSKYRLRVRIPDENGNMTRSPVSLHYHRAVMQKIAQAPWPKLIKLLGITEDDRVIVVGAGYGWGLEKLIELTGCKAVGTDISEYIQDTKDDTEESEIRMCINAAGYDPSYGHGKEVMEATHAMLSDKALYDILNEEMGTQESRGAVIDALGCLPTLVITEDMLSDLSDLDAMILCGDLDRFGCRVCHFSRELPRSAKELHALTNHIVVTVGTMRRVG